MRYSYFQVRIQIHLLDNRKFNVRCDQGVTITWRSSPADAKPTFGLFFFFLINLTMPKASKADKPKIPDIPWAEDDFKLVSASLTELEKVENYNWALFGKKTPGEVSST